jgi:prepilin-type N-terminal cleavage/methylation domain-containing protein
MRSTKPKRGERGLTLIEMMIAVVLVAALMTGLLMVMRTSMVTYEKLNHRLEDNRRVMGLQQALHRQIAGILPVMAGCAGPGGVMAGDQSSLRFVSSDSLAEGSRGYPRAVELRAAPDPNGGVRLMMTESFYSGVLSTAPCGASGGGFAPIAAAGQGLSGQGAAEQNQPVEMAGKLAYLRFAYQDVLPDSPLGGAWLPEWSKSILPIAVRIEMAPMNPDANALPALTLNVPIRLTRQLGMVYVDQ